MLVISLTIIHSEKERESAELDNLATAANNALQMADTMLTNLKTQIKDKKEELRGAFFLVGSFYWTHSFVVQLWRGS